MNSIPSKPSDDDHCSEATLKSSAAALDVYKRERLDYTEIPVKVSKQGKRAAGKTSFLQAVFHWVLSR